MHLSIKEAARILKVSENKVRGYILSGRLVVERKGRQILIPEAQLKALVEAEQRLEEDASQKNLDRDSTHSHEASLDVILNRLASLEAQIVEKGQMGAENQSLHQLVREQDRQLAEKDLEIEKLRRDLVYQKRLCDKEIEDRRLALEERWALMEQEASKRAAQERELLEQRLIQERNIGSERLAQQQERFAQEVAAMRNQEGFWARLMKMITWS
jgi:excisionase family DNA binding protein